MFQLSLTFQPDVRERALVKPAVTKQPAMQLVYSSHAVVGVATTVLILEVSLPLAGGHAVCCSTCQHALQCKCRSIVICYILA